MSGKQTEATGRGLKLIADGIPVRKAAEMVGLHPGTLSRAKKRAGMPEGKAGRPAKQPTPEKAAKYLWDEHEALLGTMPDAELARRLGIVRSAVHAARTQRGIPAFVKPGSEVPAGVKKEEATARGLKLYMGGMTLREAAASVGVHQATLIRAKKRAGMEPGKAGRRAKQQEPAS